MLYEGHEPPRGRQPDPQRGGPGDRPQQRAVRHML